MKGKITLLATACLFYTSSAMGIANTQNYIECTAKEVSDSGLTNCLRQEVKHFEKLSKDNINYIKNVSK